MTEDENFKVKNTEPKKRPQSSRTFQGNNNSIGYSKFLNGAI